MRIELRLVGTGWLRADLYVDGGHASINASYLSHALRDLVVACALIGEGIDRVECRWRDEPGGSLWALDRLAGDRVRLRVIRAADDDDATATVGRVVLDADHDLRRFLAEVLAAVDELHEDVGEEGYAERWVEHPFPVAAVERLREAVHGFGVGPVPWSQVVRAGAHRWFGVEQLAPLDLAIELLVDAMYELADARAAVCVVDVTDRSIALTDDGPGWRARPVHGEDALSALLRAVHLPAVAERGELAHVAAASRRFVVETVVDGSRRAIALERGAVVDGPTSAPASGARSMTRIACEPDWEWFGADAGWPVPFPDVVGLAAERCRGLAWWHPSILDRMVVTDLRSCSATGR